MDLLHEIESLRAEGERVYQLKYKSDHLTKHLEFLVDTIIALVQQLGCTKINNIDLAEYKERFMKGEI